MLYVSFTVCPNLCCLLRSILIPSMMFAEYLTLLNVVLYSIYYLNYIYRYIYNIIYISDISMLFLLLLSESLRPMGFMFPPEKRCSLQLLFATMNQDGEVWSWTIISRIVPRWNYFSMHCFVPFLWPKTKVACLGFPVLTNVLRCPGDRVPVECCVKVNDLELKGLYVSKREALSVLPQAMGRNAINLTMSIPTSSKVPWVFLMSAHFFGFSGSSCIQLRLAKWWSKSFNIFNSWHVACSMYLEMFLYLFIPCQQIGIV